MTLRFAEPAITVGENVGASNASITAAPTGENGRSRSTASWAGGTSPSTTERNASTSGPSCGSGRYAAIRSISWDALTSGLSAIPGIEAWPERPSTRRRNGAVIFSATVAS